LREGVLSQWLVEWAEAVARRVPGIVEVWGRGGGTRESMIDRRGADYAAANTHGAGAAGGRLGDWLGLVDAEGRRQKWRQSLRGEGMAGRSQQYGDKGMG
jgi:hypothetical protein